MRRGETDTGCLALAIIIAIIILLPIFERLVGVMEQRENRLSHPAPATAPPRSKS